ncbi:MAG: rhodanese-like protein [Myxococcaceae bacterium]|nr:rhodanese-like protein [Myxococcaceae bacterium]
MDLSTILMVVAVVGAVAVMILRSRGNVSSEAARKLVQDGAKLIDVRSPGEFSGGHLPGATNLPIADLSNKLGKLGPKDKPIVLYCASGARSAMAAGTLKRAGFLQVHNLGAMRRW